MSENRETVILDVQLDAQKVSAELNDVVTRIAALKAQQADLTKQIKDGNDVNGKYAEQLIRVKDQLSWCEKQAKGLSATSKLLTADTLTYADSLNGERQKLADMQKAYDQLDASMRNSEGGKAFLQAIKDQSDAVKGLEEETGRAQRNVGNYPKELTALIPGFDKVTGAIDKVSKAAGATGAPLAGLSKGLLTATKAALKFIATPIGAIIAAIVAAIKLLTAGWHKLTEAIGKNDDAGTAIARLYAVTIQPVVDAVTKAFAKLAEWVGKVAGKLADFLGGSREGARAAEALVVAVDNLQEAERQYTVSSAKNNAEIAKLRDQAVDKEKYTAEQRKEFLEQAIELERQNLEEDKRIKAEQLRILEETAKREQDTSDETKDKIAQARAAMFQAEEAYYSGTRRLNQQIASFNNEIAAEENKRADEAKKRREAAAKAAEEKARKEQELAEKQAATLAAIEQKQQDLAVSLISDAGVKAVEQRRLQGEREIAELQKQLATDQTLTATAKDKLAALITAKQKALNDELAKMAEDYAAAQILKEQTETLKNQRTIIELKKEALKEGSEELLALQLEALENQHQQELLEYANNKEAQKLIDEQYEQAKADLEEEYRKAKRDKDMQVAQQALSIVSNLNASINKIQNAELQNYKNNQDAKKAALEKQLQSGLISEENYNQQIAAIDEQTKQREIELQREQAKREKALNIFNAGISTAAAIIGFLANPGGIPGIALSVLAGITGAAQIAAIAAEPLPQFATGTAQVGGGRYSDGDTQTVRVAPQEMILNPRQITNVAQGLFDYANNPRELGGGLDYELLGETMANAVAKQPAPVVDYTEMQEFGQKVATYKEIARI